MAGGERPRFSLSVPMVDGTSVFDYDEDLCMLPADLWNFIPKQ